MEFKVWLAKDAGKQAKTDDKSAHLPAAVKACKRPIMEPKYDGWRGIVMVTESGVRLFNRSQKEYTGKLPELEAEFAKFPVGTILDGELVCMEFDTDAGRWVEDFFHIHTVMRSNTSTLEQRERIQYVAFDLIAHPDNKAVDVGTFEVRRNALIDLVDAAQPQGVSVTIQAEATQANHDQFVALGFEGSVIKDQEAKYGFGKRGHGCFKLKTSVTVDMVITALPMNGKGQHSGKVGHMVMGQFKDGVLVDRCTINPPTHAERDDMTRHPNTYIGRCVEVKVYAWAEDGGPRHPTFVRWRDDKEPKDCDFRNE